MRYPKVKPAPKKDFIGAHFAARKGPPRDRKSVAQLRHFRDTTVAQLTENTPPYIHQRPVKLPSTHSPQSCSLINRVAECQSKTQLLEYRPQIRGTRNLMCAAV